MNRLSLILVLLFIGNVVEAQDWTLFNLGNSYNYIFVNNEGVQQQSYEISSSDTSSTLVKFYLQKHNSELGDECYEYILSDGLSSNLAIVLVDQAYTYDIDSISEYDSLTIIHSYSGIANYIKHRCKVGDQWTSPYNDQYECTEIFLGEVFGIADSLKKINVTFWNNESGEIVISKNYGVIQMPSYIVEQTSNLIGFNNDTLLKGYTVPKFNDYFQLNVGDKLFWVYYDQNPFQPPTTDPPTRYVQEITGVDRTLNQVDYFVNNSTVPVYTFRKEEIGKILENASNWFGVSDMFQNDVYYTSSRGINMNGSDTITSFRYDMYGEGLSNNCEVQDYIADWSHFQRFNTRVGLTSEGSYFGFKVLEGYIIDGIVYGDTSLRTSISNQNEIEISLYPNPSNNFINIGLDPEDIQSVHLYDTKGREVMQSKHRNVLMVEGLENGSYVIEIKDDKDAIFREHLIKY